MQFGQQRRIEFELFNVSEKEIDTARCGEDNPGYYGGNVKRSQFGKKVNIPLKTQVSSIEKKRSSQNTFPK